MWLRGIKQCKPDSFSATESHFISSDFNRAESKAKGKLTIYIPNTFTDKTRNPVIIPTKNKLSLRIVLSLLSPLHVQ